MYPKAWRDPQPPSLADSLLSPPSEGLEACARHRGCGQTTEAQDSRPPDGTSQPGRSPLGDPPRGGPGNVPTVPAPVCAPLSRSAITGGNPHREQLRQAGVPWCVDRVGCPGTLQAPRLAGFLAALGSWHFRTDFRRSRLYLHRAIVPGSDRAWVRPADEFRRQFAFASRPPGSHTWSGPLTISVFLTFRH